MKDFGPTTHSKDVDCPECGLPAKAVAGQYGQRFKVSRHDIGENIGRRTGVICPGGKIA